MRGDDQGCGGIEIMTREEILEAALLGYSLANTQLCGVDLSKAKRTNFSVADMKHVSLRRANLEGANMSGAASNSGQSTARVIGANLQRADVREANLRGSVLVRVRFDYADLRGADFRNANITRMSLQGALYDEGAFDNSISV